MKLPKTLSIFVAFILINNAIFSQDLSQLDPMPSSKEDFIRSEPSVISVIDWLENTPLGKETDKRKSLNAILMAWLTNSPTVTISLNSKVAPLSKKNPDLLIVFMGGWTKYSLQNNYSADEVKCNAAGIKSVIKVYNLGGGVKKDKDIEKLADLDAKYELEAWIAAQLNKK